MPLANRSTTLNAVVAAAASDIPQGYAFCETSPFVGFVVADTTNRAAVGGELAGVAVSVGIAGQAFAGVAVGRCEAEEIGIIGGSGDYVDVTSTGALTRTSSPGANTIARYAPSGGIVVDLSLQDGSTSSGSAGFILVSDYGTTDTALGLADTAAQASTPPKRLLATQQITLSNSITVASEMVFEGGSVTAASAKTLTLSHSLRPERRQIVFGSAVLALGTDHKQTVCYPEMWGADPGGYLCNGVTISGGLTLANGDATVGGSGFTSAMIGRTCIVFEQLGLDVFRSTVASINSSSSLELAANSTADITTDSGSQVFIATTTDSLAAIRAAIVFSRGEAFVEFAPKGEYCVSGRVDPLPGVGSPKIRGNDAWIRYVGAAGTVKVFSSDDGTGTSRSAVNCIIENLNISGCMLAQDGVYMASEVDPDKACGISGVWRNVAAYHCTRYGQYHHAAQVTRFERPQSFFTGDHALTFIACNGSSLMDSRGSYTLGATKHSLIIDSFANGGGVGDNSYGGGDVEVYNHVCEAVTGNGIRILDTGAGASGSGSVVAVFGGHLEGTGIDGIHIARRNTVVCGVSISGPGGSTYYAYRVTADGNGSHIKCLSASSFGSTPPAQLGGIIETGATQIDFDAVYNGSTGGAYYDPIITDVWADKWQALRSTGSQYMQGKLFIGSSTYTPSTTLDDALMLHGHARLRTGGLQMHTGGVLSPYGGIGKGTNYLLRSEEFDSASWTKSNCTVTANSVLGPISGTLADTLAFSSAAGFIRQEYAYGSSLAGLDWTSGIWLRTSSGTATINIAQSVGSAATISSTTWTITTEWQFIRTTGSSSNTGTTFRLQIGPTSGTPTVYAWGACSQLVEDYAELAGGIDYAKTLGTVRTVKSQGPVFNAPPVLPGDSFTAVAGGKVAVAGAVVTITDARCTATCMVDFEPTNAAAVTLGNALRTPAAGSFALTFAGAPGGTETFNYRLTEIWKL